MCVWLLELCFVKPYADHKQCGRNLSLSLSLSLSHSESVVVIQMPQLHSSAMTMVFVSVFPRQRVTNVTYALMDIIPSSQAVWVSA